MSNSFIEGGDIESDKLNEVLNETVESSSEDEKENKKKKNGAKHERASISGMLKDNDS